VRGRWSNTEFGDVSANQSILPRVLQGAFDGDAQASPHRDQLTAHDEGISNAKTDHDCCNHSRIHRRERRSSRSLSLASADAAQPIAEQPKAQTAEPAKTFERPKPGAPQQTAKEPATGHKPAEIVKPKRRPLSTEARVIYELHRHGIYW
jgi:hypothetical protein